MIFFNALNKSNRNLISKVEVAWGRVRFDASGAGLLTVWVMWDVMLCCWVSVKRYVPSTHQETITKRHSDTSRKNWVFNFNLKQFWWQIIVIVVTDILNIFHHLSLKSTMFQRLDLPLFSGEIGKGEICY
jgi:hypothetical protein